MQANTTLTCPVCQSPMIRVSSHEQCPQCGFILPCCDGDAVTCAPHDADEHLPSNAGAAIRLPTPTRS